MVKVSKQKFRGGVSYRLTTDAHWSDIINIKRYDKDAPYMAGKVELSYSSGGANDVRPQDLAQAMVEVWQEAQEITNREVEKLEKSS